MLFELNRPQDNEKTKVKNDSEFPSLHEGKALVIFPNTCKLQKYERCYIFLRWNAPGNILKSKYLLTNRSNSGTGVSIPN